MSSSISQLKEDIIKLRYNPAAIQRKSLELLEQINNDDLDIVDPTNPFVFLLESSSVNVSAAMVHAEALTRQQYPSMAVSEDEVYLHMSDEDYIGRFSSPSRTIFTVLLNKDEVFNRAIPTDIAGMRKIVIPRHTEFKVADYTFTMEYPIDIRVSGHGGLQVVYDVRKTSPLQTVESNILDWSIIKLQSEDYIQIQIPVNQTKLTSTVAQLSLAAGYSKTFTLEDDYYFCRVFRANASKEWVEIKTTHTDQVFDPLNPTVVLKVYERQLKVSVPHVYVSNGKLDRELRIDIYTTKGPLDLILDSYEVNSFAATWRDLDKEDNGKFIAPLTVFSNMAVYSDAVVTGGTKGLSFEELRERVIGGALGNSSLPITASQLQATLANKGYTAIGDVDNVTNRIYLASRRIPKGKGSNTVAGPGSIMSVLQSTFNNIVNHPNVIDNGERVTLTPDVLFKQNNGVITLVPDYEISNLNSLVGDIKVREINNGNYITTPFYYVLDSTDNFFESRAYRLDSPKVLRRQFIQENPSLGVYLTTGNITVVKNSTGYKLQVTTKSGDVIKTLPDDRIQVQLSFRPKDERRDVFLQGTIVDNVDGERVIEFDIGCDFDIDKEHGLFIKNFQMFPDENRNYKSNLTEDFNLVYYVNGFVISELEDSSISYIGSDFLSTPDSVGVTHEKVSLYFGDYLSGFWNNSRSTVSSNIYRKYETDVPAYYEETVYERDAVTGNIKISLDLEGNIQYTILHNVGDPVLDAEGNHVLKYKAGDVMVDINGNPIIEDPRDILRECDVFFIDGRYHFSNSKEDLEYKKELPEMVVRWLKEDINTFRLWALEQTDIYLYPQRTMGKAQALIREGEKKNVDLEQSFKVTFYLEKEKYNDPFVRQVLSNIAITTINDALQKNRVGTNDIISKLTASVGEDAIAIHLNGLGGDEELTTLTLINESERCSIKKRLEIAMDGTFQVVDDVEIVFLRHESN